MRRIGAFLSLFCFLPAVVGWKDAEPCSHHHENAEYHSSSRPHEHSDDAPKNDDSGRCAVCYGLTLGAHAVVLPVAGLSLHGDVVRPVGSEVPTSNSQPTHHEPRASRAPPVL